MIDEARQKTDKMLADLERRIEQLYMSDPSLIRIRKKYKAYMKMVENKTKKEYDTYVKDKTKENKEAYVKKVEQYTSKSRQYNSLVSEITKVIAKVNQKALDMVNADVNQIYAVNYNEVAIDCKALGIKVE